MTQVSPQGQIALTQEVAACVVQLRKLVLSNAGQLDAMIERATATGKPAQVLMALFSSKQFRKRFPQLFAGIAYDHSQPEVEYDAPPDMLPRLFEHVANEWEKLGREQPAWSVLSAEEYRDVGSSDIPEMFYRSGEREVTRLMRALSRHGAGPTFHKAVEYGCGLGRVSIPLAQHCTSLRAYDISAPHLEIAKKYALKLGARHIQFDQIKRPDQPIEVGYDLYYSHLVFQHNPPPLIARLIEQALTGLAPGGIAVFQLPVFLNGYRFVLAEYLARKRSGIEMHVLPQRVVLDLMERCNCRLLEVFDSSLNLRDRILSNIFTIQKKAAA